MGAHGMGMRMLCLSRFWISLSAGFLPYIFYIDGKN